mgnify:CR=1 FL=1
MMKLENFLPKSDKGFTLIELMIVIAIIGILAAIAIPQFSAYRERSYDSAAQADLRNAATAQEAYYVDNERYASTRTNLIGATYGLFTISKGVVLSVASANTFSYNMTAKHPSGHGSGFIMRGPGGKVSKR